MNTIHILPFEGEKAGHVVYREIKMMLAVQALGRGKVKEAAEKVEQAYMWPRNLGAGKPYDNLIDTRLEDWMSAMVAIKSKRADDRESYLRKVAMSDKSASDCSALLQCVALWQLGERQKADELFARWCLRCKAMPRSSNGANVSITTTATRSILLIRTKCRN